MVLRFFSFSGLVLIEGLESSIVFEDRGVKPRARAQVQKVSDVEDSDEDFDVESVSTRTSSHRRGRKVRGAAVGSGDGVVLFVCLFWVGDSRVRVLSLRFRRKE